MKKPYEWIIFDADETLFHWDDFCGLQHTFEQYGVEFTQEDYLEYKKINEPLWVQHQNGNLSHEQIHTIRFQSWGDKLGIPPLEINERFIKSMGESIRLLDGASDLIHALKEKVKLAIISNGFFELQKKRLHKTGLSPHFEHLVVSETLGIAKPDPRIFDHALELMGNPDRDQVLMVGDNLHSDILGAHNAGVHSCWLNVHQKTAPKEIRPHYEVSSLVELEEILLNSHREF